MDAPSQQPTLQLVEVIHTGCPVASCRYSCVAPLLRSCFINNLLQHSKSVFYHCAERLAAEVLARSHEERHPEALGRGEVSVTVVWKETLTLVDTEVSPLSDVQFSNLVQFLEGSGMSSKFFIRIVISDDRSGSPMDIDPADSPADDETGGSPMDVDPEGSPMDVDEPEPLIDASHEAEALPAALLAYRSSSPVLEPGPETSGLESDILDLINLSGYRALPAEPNPYPAATAIHSPVSVYQEPISDGQPNGYENVVSQNPM
ncbi:hypothetical protein NKR23_g9552 [Pleurostoma richardsiae]|uniref:Uncharacterized protein n=1 Tax=Pleurostoma richardsiae TaxID=41990 RepID=A0AA38R6T1_9PEZI|nr:hypothetical protein NKR23_g9552 [Pleurostoma richardsiae]